VQREHLDVVGPRPGQRQGHQDLHGAADPHPLPGGLAPLRREQQGRRHVGRAQVVGLGAAGVPRPGVPDEDRGLR
jgi:hypothetical protein